MTPLPSDDIPEALRDSAAARSPSFSSQGKFPMLWVMGIGAGAIALGALTALLWQPLAEIVSQATNLRREESSTEESTANQTGVESTTIDQDEAGLLGHKPYEEADAELLVPVVGDSSIRLRPAAAESFAEMVAAARADGIRLQPLSGFRTEEEQSYLFFEISKNRNQNLAERAAVSAPPGYSEHHTGYAIDIGDAIRPNTNVSERFETTPAFEWLKENAAAYSFELSFEGGSDAAVSYEPWHWRFVGDRHSLETFYSDNSPDSLTPKTIDPETIDPETRNDRSLEQSEPEQRERTDR